MRDDTGLMSIDFIVGFTIFMVAFIIVVTMSSGLLIGLQSKTIDYDAVAYRTAVILTEDPGEGNVAWGGVNISTDTASWELIWLPPREDPSADYWKDSISRMGLAIPKPYDNPDLLSLQKSPNILSLDKVNRFFDTSLFYEYDRPDPVNLLKTIPSDYRKKVIFGDYPYKFYITLDSINPGDSIHKAVGDPNVPASSYGYIRRVVMVKDPVANFTTSSEPADSARMNISMDFTEIYNYSSPRGPVYQTDPNKEEIIMNLSGFDNATYTSPSNQTLLKSISLVRKDTLTEYAILTIYETSPTVKIYLNSSVPDETRRWISGTNELVNSNILLIFEPGYFPRTRGWQSVKTSEIEGYLNFEDPLSPPAKVGQGEGISYPYDYSPATGANPVLKPCVLEVRIW